MPTKLLKNGFTLIELMVVVAIVAITMALVVPALSTTSANNQSDNLALELESDLIFVRNRARTYAITVRMEPVTNWSSGWQILDANDQILRSKSLDSTQVSIVSDQYSAGNPFQVDAKGRVESNGDFTVKSNNCKGNHEHTISINFIGQITKSTGSC